MLRVAAEFQDVPLRDSRMFQQLPARVRQTGGERAAFVGRKFLQCVHKMHVRGAALQYIDHMLAQRHIIARARASSTRSFCARTLFALRFPSSLLFLQAYFSETIPCSAIPAPASTVHSPNPPSR